MRKLLNERIREIAASIAEENNLELVESQVAGTGASLTVRIFIDKPGGVTHDDCTLMSRKIESRLDADDIVPTAYILEVSSPGLERKLNSLKDFEKFVGNLAKVKTYEPIDGQKIFRGRISGTENDEVIFEDKTKGMVRFSYDAVAKANLEIDLEEELKRSKG